MDAAEDELFTLTTKEGKLTLEREKVTMDTSDFDAGLIFEQDPVQIIDALLPLYLNSTLLRSLQVLVLPGLSKLLQGFCCQAAQKAQTLYACESSI